MCSSVCWQVSGCLCMRGQQIFFQKHPTKRNKCSLPRYKSVSLIKKICLIHGLESHLQQVMVLLKFPFNKIIEEGTQPDLMQALTLPCRPTYLARNTPWYFQLWSEKQVRQLITNPSQLNKVILWIARLKFGRRDINGLSHKTSRVELQLILID